MPLKQHKHVHKLKRHTYKNGERVYFCVDDCSFRVGEKLALGKYSQCWICGKPFRMNEYSIRLSKPHCAECTKGKDNDTISIVDKLPIAMEIPSIVAPPKEDVVDSLKERLARALGKGSTPTPKATPSTNLDEDML